MIDILIAVGAFIVVILICVGVHELGHFVFAKLSGIRVDEFSIGFGPRLRSWRKGETRYSLRALPLGGFVRMAGMLGLPGEADAGERNFYRASIPKRLVVMFAGIAFNLILAVAIFTVVEVLPSSSSVLEGGAAAAAGLHDGDSLISIGGMRIDHSSGQSVSDTTQAALDATQGRTVPVVYRGDDGAQHTTTLTPRLGLENRNANNPGCDHGHLPQGGAYITAIDGNPVGTGDPEALFKNAKRVSGYSLGPEAGYTSCARFDFTNVPFPGLGDTVVVGWKVGMGLDAPGKPLGTAVGDSFSTIWNFIPGTIEAINVVTNTPGSGGVFGPNGLQGPVGIAAQAGQTAQQGLKADLWFIGLISMNLGFLNLLPIPFLDGGKILLVLVEAVRGKRLDPQREAGCYAIGLAIILLLVMYITIGNLRGH